MKLFLYFFVIYLILLYLYMGKENTAKFLLRVSENLKTNLEKLAKIRNRSLNSQIVHILEKEIDNSGIKK